MERHAANLALVATEGGKLHAGPGVEQTDRPVCIGGGQRSAIGTEGYAADPSAVALERDRVPLAEPTEVVPFPVAQVFRALVEQVEGAAQIVHRQLTVGQ